MQDALCSSRWFRVGAFAGRRFGAGTFPARFRRGRRRAAAGIDLQAHPSGYAVAAQSIPPLQFRDADVELLSNGIERISPADPIVNQLAQHGAGKTCQSRVPPWTHSETLACQPDFNLDELTG